MLSFKLSGRTATPLILASAISSATIGTGLLSGCSDSDSKDNSTASMTLIGRFAENQILDEGMGEIVAFHSNSKSIMVINAQVKKVGIINASTLTSEELAAAS